MQCWVGCSKAQCPEWHYSSMTRPLVGNRRQMMSCSPWLYLGLGGPSILAAQDLLLRTNHPQPSPPHLIGVEFPSFLPPSSDRAPPAWKLQGVKDARWWQEGVSKVIQASFRPCAPERSLISISHSNYLVLLLDVLLKANEASASWIRLQTPPFSQPHHSFSPRGPIHLLVLYSTARHKLNSKIKLLFQYI